MSDMQLQSRVTTAAANSNYLAEVVSVQDPDSMSRVKVKLLSFDAIGEQDAEIWARVAVPFAGNNRGAFFIPDVAMRYSSPSSMTTPASPSSSAACGIVVPVQQTSSVAAAIELIAGALKAKKAPASQSKKKMPLAPR